MSSTDILTEKPNFQRDAPDWPNREASRFVEVGGLLWHVQVAGPRRWAGRDAGITGPDGPVGIQSGALAGASGGKAPPRTAAPALLLLHGTGAATHSWAGLLPLLAADCIVLAPDLPGHGFTQAPDPSRLTLPDMAAALGALVAHYGLAPTVVVGHSAGAAIGARMCLDGLIAPRLLVSLSGALLPLRGLAGKWFSPAARLLARSGAAARYVARDARRNPDAVQRLAEGTGSLLSAAQLAHYRLLVTSPGHVAAAIHMMANWDLAPLARDLPRLAPELLLVACGNDRTVPPAEAERARALLPSARLLTLGGLGHLAHEEDPAAVAAVIEAAMARLGIGPGGGPDGGPPCD